jgi:hypothetical protein
MKRRCLFPSIEMGYGRCDIPSITPKRSSSYHHPPSRHQFVCLPLPSAILMAVRCGSVMPLCVERELREASPHKRYIMLVVLECLNGHIAI